MIVDEIYNICHLLKYESLVILKINIICFCAVSSYMLDGKALFINPMYFSIWIYSSSFAGLTIFIAFFSASCF